jgi:hypothetical protein
MATNHGGILTPDLLSFLIQINLASSFQGSLIDNGFTLKQFNSSPENRPPLKTRGLAVKKITDALCAH